MWKKLWSLNCPGKIKHHLWRLAHNSLAIRKELVHKGMELDTRCVLCSRYDEDGAHLFFKCKCVRPVWTALGLEQHRNTLSRLLFPLEAVKYILQLKEEVHMIIVTLLWLRWQERNRVREGERRISVEEVSFLCQQYGSEFLNIYKKTSVNPGRRSECWKRPEPGWMKINTNGAFLGNTGEGGWGVVIRDEAGEVVEAAAGKSVRLMDAFQSEVEACLAGVMLAGDMGVRRIVIETIALVLAQALKSSSYRLAPTGGLIWEIQSLLASNFIAFEVVPVPRSCNKVAHALAAIGCKCPHGTSLRWANVPAFVEDLVTSDHAASIR
jgi:hypothetical protein